MSKKNEYSLSSRKSFPDGANYRIEVSGIETAGILEAVVDEAKKCRIPIHRAIATVAGSRFYTDEQLLDLAIVAERERIEVIICPDDLAHGFFENPNRNLNWQNTEEASSYIHEIVRCEKLGFRGFLVWTGQMLKELDNMRGPRFQEDTIFKVSTFANSCNFLDFISHEEDGADSINAASGLTLGNLSHIRRNLSENVAMDVHITFWQQMLFKNEKGNLELKVCPYDRIADAPEIARVASPVYFKFEAGSPGINVYDVPREGWSLKDLAEHKRKDVRVAAEIVKRIKKEYPGLKLSSWGAEDLRVPLVG